MGFFNLLHRSHIEIILEFQSGVVPMEKAHSALSHDYAVKCQTEGTGEVAIITSMVNAQVYNYILESIIHDGKVILRIIIHRFAEQQVLKLFLLKCNHRFCCKQSESQSKIKPTYPGRSIKLRRSALSLSALYKAVLSSTRFSKVLEYICRRRIRLSMYVSVAWLCRLLHQIKNILYSHISSH